VDLINPRIVDACKIIFFKALPEKLSKLKLGNEGNFSSKEKKKVTCTLPPSV
jgi:hypothetical protein